MRIIDPDDVIREGEDVFGFWDYSGRVSRGHPVFIGEDVYLVNSIMEDPVERGKYRCFVQKHKKPSAIADYSEFRDAKPMLE